MPSDFYGVYLEGTLKVPNSTSGTKDVYPLWLGESDAGSPLPDGLKDLAYVQDITISIGLALNSKVSMTLIPPVDEGLEIINSELINWAGSELLVRIGYSPNAGTPGDSSLTQEFGGLVMKPDVRIGQAISITLNALGVGYGLQLSNATAPVSFPPGTSPAEAVFQTLMAHDIDNIKSGDPSSDVNDAVFPDFSYESDRDRALGRTLNTQSPAAFDFLDQPARDKIADINNPRDKNNPNAHPFFRPVSVGVKAKDPKTGEDTENTIATPAGIEKGPRNDWWFVKELTKEYGLDLIVVDKSIFIRDPDIWKNTASASNYTFLYRGAIDTEKKIYPILEFNSPSAYVWLGQGVGGAVIQEVSEETKQAIRTELSTARDPRPKVDPNGDKTDPNANGENPTDQANASSTEKGKGVQTTVTPVPVARLGDGGGAYNSQRPTQDAYSPFPGSPEDGRAGLVLNELKSYNNYRGIQAEVTTLGIPELIPGMVVSISGLGSAKRPGNAWFDGNYGIMMVEHNIGTGGMTTKFKGVRNVNFRDMAAGADDGGAAIGDSADKVPPISTGGADLFDEDHISLKPNGIGSNVDKFR